MAKQSAAVYLRVSTTDRQTIENRRIALAQLAERRGWVIVQTYEDRGISGAKRRDKHPAFDQMLKDAVRRKFDICTLYSDQQAIDSTTPFGKAMIQMAWPVTDEFGRVRFVKTRVIASFGRRQKAEDQTRVSAYR